MLHLKLLHPLQCTITHTSRPVDGVTLVEFVCLKTLLAVYVLLGIMAVIVKVNKLLCDTLR